MKDQPKLKPCPFCASDDIRSFDPKEHTGWKSRHDALVRCGPPRSPGTEQAVGTCGAIVEGKTIAKAIAAWNARHSPWIPVGERMPVEGEHVLVWGGGVPEEAATIGFMMDGGWFTQGSPGTITHWMPIPEAP